MEKHLNETWNTEDKKDFPTVKYIQIILYSKSSLPLLQQLI